MSNCIFCKIVKGDIPSYKIYENKKILAFLDLNPLTKGHTLIIPKNHYEDIFKIKEKDLKEIILVSKKVSEKLKKSLRCKGINLLNSNGKIAGQEINHFHVHVIPRYTNDGAILHFKGHYKEKNFEELTKKIRGRLK